jgi:hypothetical protein
MFGEPLQGWNVFNVVVPRVLASSKFGLTLANAFGVFQTLPVPEFEFFS